MLKRKTLAILLIAAIPLAAQATGDSYTIDPLHTFPHFTINHLGFSTMHGRFDKTSGKVTLDRAAGKGTVDIAIESASVDTGYAKRDDHLKSPDFFNAAEFPTITFKSDIVKFKGDKPSSVEGNLTLNGVTKPVTLAINEFNCAADPMDPMKKKYKCGAGATAEIRRSDFGIKSFLPAVGDDIKLEFEIEAYKD
jgi:polyisoprenoid-binding protein YceI